MNSFVDSIFIDNLHIMFGKDYLLNSVNTLFRDMPPEYQTTMNLRLYQEMNNNNEEQIYNSQKKQEEILLLYLSNLLKDFFKNVKNKSIAGGGTSKLEEVKKYIREKVSNIKPKFYK